MGAAWTLALLAGSGASMAARGETRAMRIIHVEVPLPLGGASEPVRGADYYIDGGAEEGLSERQILDVHREMALPSDPGESPRVVRAHLGQLAVLRVFTHTAVARLHRVDPDGDAPAFDPRKPMLGDAVTFDPERRSEAPPARPTEVPPSPAGATSASPAPAHGPPASQAAGLILRLPEPTPRPVPSSSPPIVLPVTVIRPTGATKKEPTEPEPADPDAPVHSDDDSAASETDSAAGPP